MLPRSLTYSSIPHCGIRKDVAVDPLDGVRGPRIFRGQAVDPETWRIGRFREDATVLSSSARGRGRNQLW